MKPVSLCLVCSCSYLLLFYKLYYIQPVYYNTQAVSNRTIVCFSFQKKQLRLPYHITRIRLCEQFCNGAVGREGRHFCHDAVGGEGRLFLS